LLPDKKKAPPAGETNAKHLPKERINLHKKPNVEVEAAAERLSSAGKRGL